MDQRCIIIIVAFFNDFHRVLTRVPYGLVFRPVVSIDRSLKWQNPFKLSVYQRYSSVSIKKPAKRDVVGGDIQNFIKVGLHHRHGFMQQSGGYAFASKFTVNRYSGQIARCAVNHAVSDKSAGMNSLMQISSDLPLSIESSVFCHEGLKSQNGEEHFTVSASIVQPKVCIRSDCSSIYDFTNVLSEAVKLTSHPQIPICDIH